MRTSLWLATLTLLLAPLALADDNNYAVGTCKPKLKSFPTIQTAVSTVPPNSTVSVCPGVYPEQVTISQPLNLQGVADSNSDQSVITIPSGGLTSPLTSIFGESVTAQVLVQASGTVNISNLTVDGTGGDTACTTWLAGIFYASGSSGSVSRVRTSNQIDAGCGVGIWAENAGPANTSVNIVGNSVHDVDGTGISLASVSPATLNASTRDNFVSPNSAAIGIAAASINGDITDNDLSNGIAGVFDLAPAVRVVANNISTNEFGLLLLGGGTVQANDITNSGVGVALGGPGAVVQSNHITLSMQAAIEFSCNPATVSHNTINDALVGLGDVPLGFTGSNNFANTGTVSTGCAAAAAMLGPMQAAAPLAAPNSYRQWRTPANPSGLRP
ncbi:MAG TPA: hypothetical protein VNY29_04260 [Terriglobales bacterium]|nr:hypothetical protein [Terriglobales bacterium]